MDNPASPQQVQQTQEGSPILQGQEVTAQTQNSQPFRLAITNVHNRIKPFIPLLIALSAIVCGILLFIFIKSKLPKNPPNQIVPMIVTPTPSPTPIRYPTNVSQSVEFFALEASVSTFAATLQEFSKEDPSLTPPSLVLPLGF